MSLGTLLAVLLATVLATVPAEPREYRALRAREAIAVDGVLDEAAWRDAPWSEPFVDIEGAQRPAPTWATRVKMVWDDDYFYVGAELEEPHVWATLVDRDAVIFHDDDFEVFIDPDGDTEFYYELEVNALGTVWDLLLVRTYRNGGPAIHEWDIAGLRSAVRVRGSLNEPADVDAGWTVEIAFPWSDFLEPLLGPCGPRPGDSWKVNFSRVDWRVEVVGGTYRKARDPATGEPWPENNWVWSPQGVVNMHLPERWGIVHFLDEEAGHETTRLPDGDR